ncbi:hypothetical protein HID58_072046 [Brassica napus]|uniref:DUF287 domain-containing protein n=2 Tax=Brassica napus TaxID=3708 RepID=A0ABQ7Z3B0_BRANA|nr:hypothetical protein HID58_072046 [Brassica napus]
MWKSNPTGTIVMISLLICVKPDLCEPSEEIKGRKRKNPSSISSGVSTRTRARKAVSDGNEPVGEDVVHEESTRVINSVLVPILGEETLLARIIDEEPECNHEGSASDTWNHWLVVKEKKIWWKELYEQDTGARSSLNGLEERILAFMDKGFSGVLSSVEPKLEVMDWRMSKLERNQRLLRSRAKKIEDRLTSIESKGNEAEENNSGEDMDFGQWDNMDCGRPEGLDKTAAEENYDRAKGKDKDTEQKAEQEAEEEQGIEVQEKQQPRKDGEKEAEEEQEKEVQDGEKEAEKEPKETPTPPRGRTKAAAARKLVHTPPEKFFSLRDPMRKRNSQEEPEKTVEEVEKTTEEEATHVIYTEEEKQSWYMVVYKGSEEESPTKEAVTPAKKKAKAEKKKVDGAPKKRGRPKKTAVTLKSCTPLPEKRKGEPSRWVQSPFTEGKTDEVEVPKKKLKTKA